MWFLPSVVAALAALPHSTAGDPPVVRYVLRADVDDIGRRVRGDGRVTFRNSGSSPLAALTLVFTPVAAPSGGPQGRFTVGEAGDSSPLVASGDSGRARLTLHQPLPPGDSAVLRIAFDASLPVDWSGHARGTILTDWYPRILDEVSRTTEPFAALGTVRLELDVATDQVVAASGVPLCGDPGWEGARRTPRVRVTLQRDWYGGAPEPAERCTAAPGRKRIVWYAESVTEVAVAMSPTFVYEEGDFLGKPVRALYEAGAERAWGAGLATNRLETALAWTTELAGRYPWPHTTVVQSGDGASRALPMLLVGSDPAQGALLDLLGLMITQQMLPGSNRALAVGAAAFETAWFFEVLGRRDYYARLERDVLDWDLDGLGRVDEPVRAARTGSPCASTYCRRTEFTYHQLRNWAGSDAPIAALMRRHFEAYRLRPAVPGSFQRLAREMLTPAPDTLYAQLPGGRVLYDDAITGARRVLGEDGRWRTTVTMERKGPGVFPRSIWVIGDADTAVVRLASLVPRDSVTLVSATQPSRVLLDPLAQSHDWNMLNNERAFGFAPSRLLLAGRRPTDVYLDTYFTQRTSRTRLTMGVAPTAWYNDAGGWTLGLRLREDYLNRFERNEAWASVATGWGASEGRLDANGQLRLRNPVRLRAPLWSQTIGAGYAEGRVAADVGVERRFRTSVTDSALRALGASLAWMTVTAPRYLDPGYWDDAHHLELAVAGRLRSERRAWRWRAVASAAAGLQGGDSVHGGVYGRFTAEAGVRRSLGRRWTAGTRLFAGAVAGQGVVRQRRLYVAGADPVERYGSPFLRSEGSILASPGFFYHAPGGAGVRGVDPHVASLAALGGSFELEYALRRSRSEGLFSRIALAAFGDAALADGEADPDGSGLSGIADAGVGLRMDQRIGRTSFQLRFDVPLWVSRPALAQDDGPSGAVGFRWLVSLVPAF